MNQGEDEARERGNPYPWNTPAHDVWNDGYQAAVSKFTSALIARKRKEHLGAHHPERMR